MRPVTPGPLSALRRSPRCVNYPGCVVARGRWPPTHGGGGVARGHWLPPPTAVSSFRESPGAGPPRWPTARVAGRSGSRPRHPLRRWLARFSPTPSSRNCSCSSPAGKAALFPRPRRCRRCDRPFPPSPTAVSSLREAIGTFAHGGVVVRRIACRRSPTLAERESRRAPLLQPTVSLRGRLARFSPTPSSRNYSCFRHSNQQFQPGAWPCSNGFEVGQAQAELRVGRLESNG
jgi:hypothetical protein